MIKSIFVLNMYDVCHLHLKDLFASCGTASNLTNAKSNSIPFSYLPACLSATLIAHQLFVIALDCFSGLIMHCFLSSLLLSSPAGVTVYGYCGVLLFHILSQASLVIL